MASVLLIEDEALIRMMIVDMLADLGHSVAGEAADLPAGLSLAETADCDAAILDVQLGPDHSEAIAYVLKRRAIPFAFATGYASKGLPEGFRDQPVLRKPFPTEELDRCMRALLSRA